MLKITIPKGELFNEETQEIITCKEQTIQLEHSLVSLSKWESKWHKPFLGKDEKTFDETIDYVRCMTITQNVDPNAYSFLSNENIEEINNYIGDPMTATTFFEEKTGGGKKEIITSEVLYYYMIALNIPFECQKWHLNRLMTLIKVCDIKSQPPKKMGKKATINHYAALNAARRKQLNSKG